MRYVSDTIIAVERQQALQILSVCSVS